MGIKLNYDIKTADYSITNYEFYLKGDLKGYIEGRIHFINGKTNDFLYRVYDPENGYSKVLVSIYYSYENPMADQFREEIATKITEAINDLTVTGNKEDLEFFQICKNA